MRTLAIIALFVAVATVITLVFADDGMATCQVHHSFDVCHDAIF